MKLIYLFLFMGMIACQTEQEAPPEIIIPDTTLVMMITDAFIYNAAFAETYRVTKDSLSQIYTAQFVQKYGFDADVFERNLDALHQDPIRLDTLMKKVVDRIEILEMEHVDTRATQ